MFRIFFKVIFIHMRKRKIDRPDNPYITGGVVGGSRFFVGRASVLQAIEEILCHSQRNGVILFGEQCVGKTSILRELENKLEKDHYQPIYLDLMSTGHYSLEMLLNYLAEVLCHQLKGLNIEKPQWNNIKEQFSHWLFDLLNKQLIRKSFVLLFDEVNAFNDAEQQLFDYLNSSFGVQNAPLPRSSSLIRLSLQLHRKTIKL